MRESPSRRDFRGDGLPFGVTLVGPRWTDRSLLTLADRLHRAGVNTLGASNQSLPAAVAPLPVLLPGYTAVSVCGAHMSGLPLNHQLRDRGSYLLRGARTAARYRLFALAGGAPHRPGLVRAASGGGAIEVEVWAVPTAHLGSFLAAIPAPLGLGKIELDTGTWETGFICEAHATLDAVDITSYGGWRAYLEKKAGA